MSFVQNIKKGLFGGDDEFEDEYIDDGPQMVNNNSGFGSSDSYDEDSGEGSKSGNRVAGVTLACVDPAREEVVRTHTLPVAEAGTARPSVETICAPRGRKKKDNWRQFFED